MVLLPTPVIMFLRRLQQFSDWIDDTFFPVPNNQSYAAICEQQAKVEKAAAFINSQIKSCQRIRHTYTVRKMVFNMKALYGGTVQVKAWQDSLLLDLYNKEKQILNNIK